MKKSPAQNSEPARRTQVQRREESSQRLIDSAFQLIAKGGMETLTLAAVSEAAGCSRELPRYLYGSKDAFIDALIDDTREVWTQSLHHPLTAGLTGADAILAMFDSLYRLFIERRDTRGRLLLVFGLIGSANVHQRKKAKAVPEALRQQILEILNSGIAAEELPGGIDAHALANLLNCTGVGIGYQWLANPRSFDIEGTLNQLRDRFSDYLIRRS